MNDTKYNYARDGFIYLLSYATLLISSVGVNFLLKAILAKYIPDPLQTPGTAMPEEAIIGFMAAVLISFPIFAYLNFTANRLLKSGKMKADSGVRTWLLYITMVVVILIIIWQVIQLIIGFLKGSLAVPFILNILITLAIAGTVLGYQWWHLRTFVAGKEPKVGAEFRIFEWVVYAAVAATVIGSFFIIGTPAERRAKSLDNIRVERLSSIRQAVQTYYGFKGGPGHQVLPASLDQLITDSRIGIPADGMLDPVSKKRFVYNVTGATTYELCATFETVYDASTVGGPNMVTEPSSTSQQFYHGKGYQCFELSATN